MNRKILQKIIDSLKQDKPNIDYVLGILDTLIDGLPEEKILMRGDASPTLLPVDYIGTSGTYSEDEASIMEAEAKAKLASVKQLADESLK